MAEKQTFKPGDTDPKKFHSAVNDLYALQKTKLPPNLTSLTNLIWTIITSREFAAVVLYWATKRNAQVKMFLRIVFGIQPPPPCDFCPARELCKLLSGTGEVDANTEEALRYRPPTIGVDEVMGEIEGLVKRETCLVYLILNRK